MAAARDRRLISAAVFTSPGRAPRSLLQACKPAPQILLGGSGREARVVALRPGPQTRPSFFSGEEGPRSGGRSDHTFLQTARPGNGPPCLCHVASLFLVSKAPFVQPGGRATKAPSHTISEVWSGLEGAESRGAKTHSHAARTAVAMQIRIYKTGKIWSFARLKGRGDCETGEWSCIVFRNFNSRLA